MEIEWEIEERKGVPAVVGTWLSSASSSNTENEFASFSIFLLCFFLSLQLWRCLKEKKIDGLDSGLFGFGYDPTKLHPISPNIFIMPIW